jgi:hypothetical protein
MQADQLGEVGGEILHQPLCPYDFVLQVEVEKIALFAVLTHQKMPHIMQQSRSDLEVRGTVLTGVVRGLESMG